MSLNVFSVVLPRGSEHWRPELFPGSDEATERGCLCPVSQPWPGGFRYAADCPVHELQQRMDS